MILTPHMSLALSSRCMKMFKASNIYVYITILGHDLHCTDSIRHPA